MRWFDDPMSGPRWRVPMAAVVAGWALAAPAAAAQADDAPRGAGGGKARVVMTGPEGTVLTKEVEVELEGGVVGGAPGEIYFFNVGETAEPALPGPGPYWLGIRCVRREVEEKLAKQANLEAAQGWFAESVIDGSPAANAGLEAGALLIAVDGKPLEEIGQLFDAVNRAGKEGKSLTLDVWQKGERQTLELKPAKRPERQWFGEWNDGAIREWLERWRQGLGQGGGPVGMMFVRPGMVMRMQAATPPLPDDVTVKIEKTGQQPAKIEVRRGDQTWNLTEGKWDELPAELRPAVAGLLSPAAGAVAAAVATGDGAGPPQITINGQPVGPQFAPPGFPAPGQPFAVPWPPKEGLHPGVRQQLEKLQHQLREMQRQLDAIQRGAATPDADAPPAAPPKTEPEKKPARKPKPTSI